ncbi:MAG: thiamine pyrophosphate-binding protein [Alphaproteobacteria bacterium]|nr:thiamine pyrophosphate-binding protein [Alphaproteobacteria bacterium]
MPDSTPDLTKFDRPKLGGNRRMGWASDVAAEMLRRLDIKFIALNPGASYRGFHDSLVNYLGNVDPQMLLCLHEDHAVAIAHGYGKVTGEPMGCVLHSNVGLMHGLMNVFNAWCGRVPMVVMGATGPVDSELRRPWIDWIHTAKDQGALLRSYVKWDDEPRSAQAIVESMLRAVQITKTAPHGPVYVCLDAGLQETELKRDVRIPEVARYRPADPSPASAEAVKRAVELLTAAKSPLILAGRVSRRQDDWVRRVKLAELLGAGVLTDLKSAASFPSDHALMVSPPASHMTDAAKAAFRNADVILSLDWLDLGGTFKTALGSKDNVAGKVIHASLDSYLHNGWSMDHFHLAPNDLPVLADPDVFTGQLLDALAGRRSAWDGKPKATRAPIPKIGDRDQNARITPRDVALALNEAKGQRAVTLARVPLGWAGDAYHFTGPLDYMGNDGGGGLGNGPGAAIGTALGLLGSGRTTISILGDGDFMQGGTALWTAAHYKIPVLFVISNNRSNFNDEIHQETVAKDRGRPVENRWIGQQIDHPTLDLAGFARAQGIKAEGPVETIGALVPAMRRALAAVDAGEPFLLDVHVEPGYAAPMATRASGEGSAG